MDSHFMNPQYEKMMMGHGEGAREQDEGPKAKAEEHKRAGQQHLPHIHIHPHHDEHGTHAGTTVHIMHHDGTHEKHEHEPGDADGIAAHIHEHFGGGHDSGEETGEMGASPGGAEAAY